MPNFNKALIGLMAASYTSTTTAGSYSREVDRMGIYKSVRTIIGAKQKNNVRKLQDTLLTTRCFTHCIEQNLTPEECQAYIESEITAAGGHEVGPVTVKIQEPRPQESFDDTYWMTEVPVNLYGQMTCDRADGIADYPFLWTTPGGEGVAVPVVDCQGLTGGECCMQLRQLGEQMGKDENGNCLACFPHQEPLVPVIGEGGGSVVYLDYEFDGTDCVEKTLTPGEVGAIDEVTGTAIISAASALKTFRDSPTCDGFENLLMQLYDAAVVIPSLPQYIGRLACDYCYSDYPTDYTTPEFTELITEILSLIEPVPEFDSTENCVIIYTNKNGDIAEVPKLGGSRAEDPYDDDCPPDSTPSSGTPTDGSDGTAPPDGGENTPDDGTPTDGGDGTVPPDGGENAPDDGTPADGGDVTVPPDGGENAPDDGTPADGGNVTAPPDGGEITTPPDDGTPAAGTNDGGDDGSSNPPPSGEDGPTCYTKAEDEPSELPAPFGTYTPPKACALTPTPNTVADYQINFIESVVLETSTLFKYVVCGPEIGCERRALKGGGKPNKGTTTGTDGETTSYNNRAAISHTQIGINGSCTIIGATMYDDMEGTSSGNDFPAEPEYGLGKDPTTCVPGFKFNTGWGDNVEGCAEEDRCRMMEIEVAGSVPEGAGVGAIKAATVFYEFGITVPDCTTACA